MSGIKSFYRSFKSRLPAPMREALSAVNQRFFARKTIQRQYGDWFDVDWRKKFRSLSNAEWQKTYDRFWRHRTNDCVEETDSALILAALGQPGTVLEVGCGMGGLAMRLAERGFSVTGLDLSEVALRYARERADNAGLSVDWKQGFAESLPVPDKSFNYVTCCHTLEHVKELDQAVAELRRVAREKIVVIVPKQKYRLYADNYHTQFFERKEQLIDAFGLENYQCMQIDCIDHQNEFQGQAFFYLGFLQKQTNVSSNIST